MLVNPLLLLLACCFSGVISYDEHGENDYADLLSLLYERYKLFKSDGEAVGHHRHHHDIKHHRNNFVNKREHIVAKQDVSNTGHDGKTANSKKRNNMVIADDDIEKWGSVHDDINLDDDDVQKWFPIINHVEYDHEKNVAQNKFVPIHDVAENSMSIHNGVPAGLLDDSKTLVTVEKKENIVNNENKNINIVNDGGNDEEKAVGIDILQYGTYNIKNMNNHKEENVVEIGGQEAGENFIDEGYHFPEAGEHLIEEEHFFPEVGEPFIHEEHHFPEAEGHLVDGSNRHIDKVVEHVVGSDKHLIHKIEENIEKPNKPRKTTEDHIIAMPDVSPKTMDTYLCYAYKLEAEDRYIVEYHPLADKQTAHHMLLFACGEPFRRSGVWGCREMAPVCTGGGGQSIMYAWAKNAPSLKMPTNVGFHVGGDTGFKYLVLQVHYLHVDRFKNGATDNSGIRFVLDEIRKRYLAGIYLLANGGSSIPPHMNKAYIDMGCFYPDGPTFFPFRFRVHAHKLGVVITGYRVRKGNWTLIGRGDPQRPQAFYPVFNDIDIKHGDTIMGRCTYNSMTRDKFTYIGATHADEMCNFYIMYFYDSNEYNRVRQFPCREVTEHQGSKLFNKFPIDSDIPSSIVEEAYRQNFAKNGMKDLSYIHVHDWPHDGLKDGDLPLTVGQISGVALTADQTEVVIIHRADRYWGGDTFRNNILALRYRVPIKDNTLIWLDRNTGAITSFNGRNMFYLPHGITIDDDGNIWITDVGSHQVYKLSPDMKVLLTLGHRFVPGTGDKHFCKPTDVAVMKNGHFFVSDGYCNDRVVKFNSGGKMLLQISGDKNPNKGLFKSMAVVHSLSLDHIHDCLFVADRENGRILVFNATLGKFLEQIKVPEGAVYAVEFNVNQGGLLHFVTGPLNDLPVTIRGYTYSFYTKSVVSYWAPEGGFSFPHDLAVSRDNQNTFVAEINPFKIWKFARKAKTRP